MPSNNDLLRNINASQNVQLAASGAQLVLSKAQINIARKQADIAQRQLGEQSKTNAHLDHMEEISHQTNRWLSSVFAQEQATTGAIKQLTQTTEQTNRLLIAQTGAINNIEKELASFHRDFNAYSWAMWIQSENGKTYLDWNRNATRTMTDIQSYTLRMQKARAEDVRQLVAATVQATPALAGKDLPLHVAEAKSPESIPLPKKPDNTFVGRGPEVSDPAYHSQRIVKRKWWGALLGMGAAVIIFLLFHTPSLPTPEEGSWFIFWMIFLGLCILIGHFMVDTPSITYVPNQQYKQAFAVWESQVSKSKATRAVYEKRAAEVNAHNASLKKQFATERAAEEQHVALVNGLLENIVQSIDSSLPPATSWSTGDPMGTAKKIAQMAENAPTAFPAPEVLPNTTLPEIRPVDKLPEYAVNMREELGSILAGDK